MNQFMNIYSIKRVTSWSTKHYFTCNFKNSYLTHDPKILIILTLVINSSNNIFTPALIIKGIIFIKKG